MAQRKTSYSAPQFIGEVKKRLAPIYSVDDTYIVSKNKITFTVNNHEFILNKDKDKTSNKRKIIIESAETEDMFPVAFNIDDALKFKEDMILKTVQSIDEYLMEKAGYPNYYAICNKYNAIKWALLPCYVVDFTDTEVINKTQAELLSYTAYEAFKTTNEDDRIKVLFIAKNVETDEDDRAFMFVFSNDKLSLYSLKFKDGVLYDNEEDSEIGEYNFSYVDYPDNSMMTIVKKILKPYYDFRMYEVKFSENIELEEKIKDEEITEDVH